MDTRGVLEIAPPLLPGLGPIACLAPASARQERASYALGSHNSGRSHARVNLAVLLITNFVLRNSLSSNVRDRDSAARRANPNRSAQSDVQCVEDWGKAQFTLYTNFCALGFTPD